MWRCTRPNFATPNAWAAAQQAGQHNDVLATPAQGARTLTLRRRSASLGGSRFALRAALRFCALAPALGLWWALLPCASPSIVTAWRGQLYPDASEQSGYERRTYEVADTWCITWNTATRITAPARRYKSPHSQEEGSRPQPRRVPLTNQHLRLGDDWLNICDGSEVYNYL